MTDVSTKQWYIVHTYSGFEKKVADSLQQRVQAYDLQNDIGEILIPDRGRRGDARRQEGGQLQALLSGLHPDRDADVGRRLARGQEHAQGHRFRRAQGSQPTPLTREEVDQILHQVTVAAEKPKPKYSFDRGDQVRINEGPFTSFNGVVDEVNIDRNTLKVMVTIFGRSTPVELDFLQVEKI